MLFYDCNDLKKSLTVFTFIQSNSNNKNKLYLHSTFLNKVLHRSVGVYFKSSKNLKEQRNKMNKA